MSKKLKVREATSYCDGIEFYSTRNSGYIAKAILVEDGTIVTSYTKERKKLSEKKSFFRKIVEWAGIITFSIVFTTIMYLVKADVRKILSIMCFTVSVFVSIDFVVEVTKEHRTSKGKSRFRYHAAEHMAINAMNEIQRVPTLEEIKRFSRFSNNCGSNVIGVIIIIYLWWSFCINLWKDIIPCIVVSILGMWIIILLRRLGGLNFLQYLSTIPPTDKELEVAIAGIQVWFEHEKAKEESL